MILSTCRTSPLTRLAAAATFLKRAPTRRTATPALESGVTRLASLNSAEDTQCLPDLGERFRRRLNGLQPGADLDRTALMAGFVLETHELLRSLEAVDYPVMARQLTQEDSDLKPSAVENFARRMAYSHVILLASVFETFLERACATLLRASGGSALTHRLGSFERRQLLEKCLGLPLDDGHWQSLMLLPALKRALVNGETALSSSIWSRLCAQEGLHFQGRKILVEPAYVQRLAVSLRQLMEAVGETLGKPVAPAKRSQTWHGGWLDTAKNEGGV